MVSAEIGMGCCWHADTNTEMANAMIVREDDIPQKCNNSLFGVQGKEKQISSILLIVAQYLTTVNG
jgi:hypothetical protein